VRILEELGVRSVVNASGTVTGLGNSIMEPEVVEAMSEAAKHFVDMSELMSKGREIIRHITRAEDGLITSGAAASLVVAAAGCMTGTDLTKVSQLPDTAGLRNEIIVQRVQRNPHDRNLRTAGAKIVEIGSLSHTARWELEAAINERTAAVAYFVFDPQPGVLPLVETLQVAHEHNVPVIVDAAAEVPPQEHLTKYALMGADLVAYSGGKAILGPSDTGILCGKKSLIEACAVNAFLRDYRPSSSPLEIYGVGRSMKISKEQIVGLIVALQRYMRRDHEDDMKRWWNMTKWMAAELNLMPHVEARATILEQNPRPISIPKTEVRLDELSIGMTLSEISNRLWEGDPRVAVAYWPPYHRCIYLNPQCLLEGEEKIVVQRMREIFANRRRP
jgi:L-seryl-tRNA(Ser) seleniumtransferase